MKQRITQGQWNELSVLSHLKLRAFIDPGGHPSQPDPLLTIGEMIEFLMMTDYDRDGTDQRWLDISGLDHVIEGQDDRFGDSSFGIGWKGEELCDRLWECVKEVIERA